MNLFWNVCVVSFAVCFIGTAHAEPICSPFEEVAETLPLNYLDRADPMSARVAQSLEDSLLSEQASSGTQGILVKVYCNIGLFKMNIRFFQPVEDDAIRGTVTEAVYNWDTSQDPAGWMLSQMNRQNMCARGDAPFAAVCK